ncbi:hypothetical protein IFM89_004106 [Coptis chinensis]|uniref:Uncharacterized protein n=1 Tax=Coptis chinensis TaxID=261450 RepID=A0A835H4G7_9MAGN|nr:hypothetical protein IFM89_004106 [Coptis chinensis]
MLIVFGIVLYFLKWSFNKLNLIDQACCGLRIATISKESLPGFLIFKDGRCGLLTGHAELLKVSRLIYSTERVLVVPLSRPMKIHNIRLEGGVAKALLHHIEKHSYDAVSSSCLEQYTVEKLTVTR